MRRSSRCGAGPLDADVLNGTVLAVPFKKIAFLLDAADSLAIRAAR